MSDHTEEVADAYAEYLMSKKNVVGVGGGPDKVLVLVTKKEDEQDLFEDDIVERYIEGERTDVVVVGEVEAKLAPGTSIGVPNRGTGTAGGVVVDSTGVRYVLTNNHVAADTNRVQVLTAVHSPGPADRLGPRFGRLARFEPVYFDRNNFIDAALVRLDGSASFTHPSRVMTPQVGWTVIKRGRTTGRTTGVVRARNVTVDVNMGNQGTARFRDQIMTSYMLAAGDSGSVLTTTGGYPCGLGFAGSSSASFHNPIQTVLSLMGVGFR